MPLMQTTSAPPTPTAQARRQTDAQPIQSHVGTRRYPLTEQYIRTDSYPHRSRCSARRNSPLVTSTLLRNFAPSSTNRSTPSGSEHRKLLDPCGIPRMTRRWSEGRVEGV
jgi:hypothetical protein